MARIMVVESNRTSRKAMVKYLKSRGHEVMEIPSGAEALRKLRVDAVDIILMDVNSFTAGKMEEAVSIMRESETPIVIIAMIAFNDEESILKTVRMGIDDFIPKPVNPLQLEARIELAMKALKSHRIRDLRNSQMVEEHRKTREALQELEAENARLAFELLKKMYIISEFKDFETHEHAVRVGAVSALLAERLKRAQWEIINIQLAAPLHDIGKIGIPERILLKSGKLSDEEFEIVKQHCEIGYRILSDSLSSILNMAARIALTHHERWNGTGYPQGLKGTEIPWESRIVAVADSLDAMTSTRPYRKARTFDEAVNEIIDYAGMLYDPEVVGALESSKTEVCKLYEEDAKMLSSMKIHLFNSITSWTSWWKAWMKSQSKVTQDDEHLSRGG